MSLPLKTMRPRVGVRNLVRRLKQVVFPAPFGPIKACTVPRAMRNDTPATATKPTNSIVRSSVSRITSLLLMADILTVSYFRNEAPCFPVDKVTPHARRVQRQRFLAWLTVCARNPDRKVGRDRSGPARRGPGYVRALLHDRRLDARHVRRCDTHVFAVLPLADEPDFAQHARVELGVAEDGLEGAVADGVGDLGPVDLAHLLDRLLQHLQRGVGVGARPAVGLLALIHRLVARDIVLDAGTIRVPGAEAEDAVHLVAELALVGRKGDADAEVLDLRIV